MTEEEQIAIAKSAKRVVLKEIDHDPEDLTDPRVLELQQIIDNAPDFIRSSDLELREKAYVADAQVAAAEGQCSTANGSEETPNVIANIDKTERIIDMLDLRSTDTR